MQKKLLGILLALCMLLAVLPLALTAGATDEATATAVRDCAHTTVTDGVCANENCGATAISTAEDLLALMDGNAYTGTDYFLAKDIDMTDASGMQSITSFSGVFDGNGYTISGLSTTNGLFAAATNAEIYDLTVAGTVTGTENKVGGIVGDGTVATGEYLYISGCTNYCTVNGNNYVGGIVGCIGSGLSGGVASYGTATITECRNVGSITATTQGAGGIVGYVKTCGTAEITECLNIGNITQSGTTSASYKDAGGILGTGWAFSVGTVTVSNCINIGAINAYYNAGGIVGRLVINNGCIGTVEYCFNGGTTTATKTSGAIVSNPIEIDTTKHFPKNNYYTFGTKNTGWGTEVTDVDNAEEYSGFSTDTWLFTTSGPRLICHTIQIDEVTDLVAYSGKAMSGNFCLMADLDLTDKTFSSITSFSGLFDGNGHTISGLSTTNGLFATATNARIYDLTVAGTVGDEDSTAIKVGGIVGNSTLTAGEYLYISGCTNMCTVTGSQYVGGIVGYVGDGSGTATITECRNTGAVKATYSDGKCYVGGIVSYVYGTKDTHTVSACMNIADVYGANDDVGGILGIACSVTVTNCINLGTVTSAKNNAGGIVGRTTGTNVITCSFNGGTITASRTDRAHATVGYKGGIDNPKYNYHTVGAVHDTYQTIEVASDNISNADSYTGLDFDDVWFITKGGPRLQCMIEEISTADDLFALMGKDVLGWYELTDDIDMSKLSDDKAQSSIASFSGWFDGNGYTISGLETTYGLFAAATNAEIYNLTVAGTVGTADSTVIKVGGIVGAGNLNNATYYLVIQNCTNACTVTGGQYVGGVVGYLGRTSDTYSAAYAAATVTQCRNTGDVHANTKQAGGIVGYAYGALGAQHQISECMNTGAVSTDGDDVGGILGISWGASVSDSLNTGAISATGKNAGGIAGRTHVSSACATNAITYCYNSGTVTGTSYAFVIVGNPDATLVANANKKLNYDSTDASNSTRFGTYVANIADASEYTNLNTNHKWIFTDDGPRLKRFSVVISAEVTAVTDDTATVAIYAESGVPFWGVVFDITAGDWTISKFVGKMQQANAVEPAEGFVYLVSDDKSKVAILQLKDQNSTLTKTLVAELTFATTNTTDDQKISFNIAEAYDANVNTVDAYGAGANISLSLTGLTYGHGVVLDSEYVLEYTIKQELLKDLPENADMYMLFETTDANGNVTVTSVEPYLQSSSNKLRFSAPGIAAKNMGDVVKGTFYYVEADGTRHYAYTDTYNLISYYEKMHGKGYGTTFDAALNAMLNYGAAAQTYFDYDTEHLVNADFTEDQKTITCEDPTSCNKEETVDVEGLRYTLDTENGFSAVLTQRIQLVLKFALVEGAEAIGVDDLTFKVEYTDINDNPQSFDLTAEGGQLELDGTSIVVYIDQVAAKDLRCDITGKLYNGETQVSSTVTTDFESYAATVLDEDFTSDDLTADKLSQLQAVCRATLAYVDAAEAYLGK